MKEPAFKLGEGVGLTPDQMAEVLDRKTGYSAVVEALDRLWCEVARYDSIGHEGSELLEVMSDARAALALVRGPVTGEDKGSEPKRYACRSLVCALAGFHMPLCLKEHEATGEEKGASDAE